MLIIDETLYVPKGATSIIEFTIEDYICQKGDLVVFAVKNKNQPEEDKTELISKEIHIKDDKLRENNFCENTNMIGHGKTSL